MKPKYPRSDFHIVYKHHLTYEVKWSGVQFQIYTCAVTIQGNLNILCLI
jgi:hypothetical protein